jgi:hypothetical protein
VQQAEKRSQTYAHCVIYRLVENDFSVNSMAINPVNEGLLLIAYANGFIVEWDLKTRSTVKARHSKQVLTF